MSVAFTQKDKYSIEDLLEIMRLLRSDDGCPWDREQTHKSIRSDFLEETHEVIEAINNEDTKALQEELGDVLLQVVFHTRIEEEKQAFDFNNVVDGICKKLVVRHPHVFADGSANNTTDVLRSWDSIKRKTKGGKSQADLLKAVPRTMPALMRSDKVQYRAKRVGFDWPDVTGAFEALESETKELKKAIADGDAVQVEEELGDVLFSAVNVSRFVHCDAEQALTVSCDKFIKRFAIVESLAAEQGLDMTQATPRQLDELWLKAKSKSAASAENS